MIIVHGTIPIKAECKDDALLLARRMADLTRSEEGCISYDFYVGLSDPNTLMLFQEWENMEALMAHFQTDHMDEFLNELPDIVSGQITTKRYAVQSVDEGGSPPEETPPVIH
jgi:quinol monooxygenase YgiN